MPRLYTKNQAKDTVPSGEFVLNDILLVVLIMGGMSVVFGSLLVLGILTGIASDKLYEQTGCEKLQWKPIPKHFLDNGYYEKDGWTCPK